MMNVNQVGRTSNMLSGVTLQQSAKEHCISMVIIYYNYCSDDEICFCVYIYLYRNEQQFKFLHQDCFCDGYQEDLF